MKGKKIISTIIAIAMISSIIYLITINMNREVNQSVIGIIESKNNASSYYDGNNLNKTNVTATA